MLPAARTRAVELCGLGGIALGLVPKDAANRACEVLLCTEAGGDGSISVACECG